MEFKLHSKYKPTGDQPQAIRAACKRALRRATSLRPYLELPAPARPLPWLMSLQHSISLHLSYRTIRHWRGSSMVR